MGNTEITKQGTFNQFIDKYSEPRHCLELLRFFSTHPYTRFDRLAVIHAQNENDRKSEIERALVHLTDKRVVKACNENNAHLYSLTEDESIRRRVLELAKLEWHHWQLALRKAHSTPM